MKKLFLLGAFFFGCLMNQSGYSQNNQQQPQPAPVDYQSQNQGQYQGYQGQGPYAGGPAYQGQLQGGEGGCCAPAEQAPCDQPAGDCWCLYTHYEPCYYTTKRCVEEQIPCRKKCCRMVPQYYEVQRCRMVPQYYCETCCRQVPEYYYVDECKTCKKWVCDTHCKYVPKQYWKHVCGQPECGTQCGR